MFESRDTFVEFFLTHLQQLRPLMVVPTSGVEAEGGGGTIAVEIVAICQLLRERHHGAWLDSLALILHVSLSAEAGRSPTMWLDKKYLPSFHLRRDRTKFHRIRYMSNVLLANYS